MASLSVRRLDGEVFRRLKIQAQRDGLSMEETVRRILTDAVVDLEPAGAMIDRLTTPRVGRPRRRNPPHRQRSPQCASHVRSEQPH